LQVGGGKNFLNGWLNADLFTGNIYLNARKPFPFNDNMLNYIFCEHLLCQLSPDDGANFLKECYRTLKPRGVLRLTTPDLEKIIALYFGNTKQSNETRQQFLQKIDMVKYSPCEFFNSYFYSYGHRFIYDKDFIVLTLQQIGFKETTFCENKKSTHKRLIDIEKHGDIQNLAEALTIEAIK
jgi:predicted SAM-dependent methyltransferase